MFKLVLLVTLTWAAATLAAPKEGLHEIPIIKQESSLEPDGSYHHSFESEDGIKVGADGEIKVIDKDTSVESVKGFWEYTDGGKTYHSEYTADENGFNVVGDHIPAVPDYILRALEWNQAHPSKDD